MGFDSGFKGLNVLGCTHFRVTFWNAVCWGFDSFVYTGAVTGLAPTASK